MASFMLLKGPDLSAPPLMAAGVTSRLWEIGDIIDVLTSCYREHPR
jgi:hypothetical protein